MKQIERTRSERNYGIDLMRIFAMLLVVVLHILGNGGVLGACKENSFKYCVGMLLHAGAFCAVNCYALVSGYVGWRSDRRFSSICCMWLQVALYSVAISVILCFLRGQRLGIGSLAKEFLPITFGKYWYFTAYFGMWFFIPLMNSAVQNMPKRRLGICLLLPAVIMIPIALLTGEFGLSNGYSVIWLCYLYLIGAYIARYELFKNVSAIKCIVVYALCALLTFASKYAIQAIRGTAGESLYNYISPLVLLEGVALLVLFSKIKPPKKLYKLITTISATTFGVYLIHTHPSVFTHVLKGNCAFLAEHSAFVTYLLVLALAVGIFIACSLIDFIREVLFKAFRIKKLLNVAEDFAACRLRRLLDKQNTDKQ